MPNATCTRCQRDLPLEHFYKRREKRSKLGRQSWCKDCQHQRINDFRRSAPPEQRAAWSQRRRETLMKQHGLTVEQYDSLLEDQGGCCAICRRAPKRGPLCVDHDHATGTVRGLLCNPCNTAIGSLGDDVERVMNAAAYLAARSYHNCRLAPD